MPEKSKKVKIEDLPAGEQADDVKGGAGAGKKAPADGGVHKKDKGSSFGSQNKGGKSG